MAPTPFRRRGKLGKAARNIAIADAAIALARDRVGSGSRRRRGPSGKMLLLGGAAVAAAAGALWKRDQVAGLLPSRSETTPEPVSPPPPPPPEPSNYDAPGPPANTATPVPAPDPQEPMAIDEAAEEAAAAAEAANIGGKVSDYVGFEGETATEAERPLAEAGEGEAEGEEQAEHDLVRAAEPTPPGMTDTERQIEDAIEAAENPATGERVEAVTPSEEPADTADQPVKEETLSESGATPDEETAPWAPPAAGRDEPAPFEPGGEKPPAEEASAEKPAEEKSDDDDSGGSDWQTWSGRSVNP